MYAGILNYQEFGSRSPTGIGNSSGWSRDRSRLINFGKLGSQASRERAGHVEFFRGKIGKQEMIREILNRLSLYKLTPKFRKHGFRGGEFFWLKNVDI